MGYNDTIKKIPACAISTNGADMLSDMLTKDPDLMFTLNMQCQMLPEEKSYNVIGEIKGSEFPNEYIVIGGHLDSWDIGDGAHDDGAGIVQSMELLYVFKALGIKPKRTIRVVAFMNEENGGRGGKKYAEQILFRKEKHILAIESDAGGDTPLGFGMNGPKAKTDKIRSWKKMFYPYGIFQWDGEHDGADISHLREDNKDNNIVLMGLSPDSQRYFEYHHSAHDVFSRVNRRSLELGAAAMISLIYLVDKYGLN
jgi:carboxypeptidase Q